MKKRTKIIIGLAALCAGTLILGACGGDESPYPELVGRGFDVKVCYDSNGGSIAARDNAVIVDSFSRDRAAAGVKLIAPEDSRRGDVSVVTRNGYFLAGWYKTRELRVDEDGNPVDEDGNLCSVSGKAQGYSYADRWDFDEDTFVYTPSSDEEERALTLYAGWIPEFSYRVYGEKKDGWEVFGTFSYNPLNSPASASLAVPVWNDETGAMDYGSFPHPNDKTFEAAYADSQKTQRVETLENHGEYDLEHGIAKNGIAEYYADWLDGIWFRVSTAQQFIDNYRMDGCYNILQDLDFEKSWGVAISQGSFGGKILGNGHKFFNIAVTQKSVEDTVGGLFGRILETAEFEKVTFEGVEYKLSEGSRKVGAQFGLFAGSIAENAKMTDVSVTGTLVIAEGVYPVMTYDVGLLSGNLVTAGISIEGITLTTEGNISATADQTGRVTISM